MMNYELIAAAVTFFFVSTITPGPNNLMLMASGANFGFRRTLPHMLGVAIGFTLMVLLIGLGLMQLFIAFPLSYLILKWLSVAYLLFLAWKIATTSSLGNDPDDEAKGKPFTFLQAALFQWVNPKAWAIALVAINIYAPPSHPLAGVFLVAFLSIMACLPSATTWTLLGTQLRRLLTSPLKLRIFNVVAAFLLICSLYPILIDW